MYNRNIYIDKILPFINQPVIKVITGMRRVGKSYFIKQLIGVLQNQNVSPSNILYIDKELLEFDDIETYTDLDQIVSRAFSGVEGRKYLFVDEVQEIINWEKAILSIANTQLIDCYITGSNANMLSSELATLLSGRYIEFPLYSLSLEEFIQFRGAGVKCNDDEFLNYIKFGGLPAIHHFDLDPEIVFQYVGSIYNTILLKDVIKKNQVRNVQLLENIYRYVFDNIGNIFSAKKISDYMKNQRLTISIETVQNYLSYLIDALTIYKVQRYDLKGKRLLEIYEKYYIGDIGMRHAILGYRESDISGILENIVFLELKRRGYTVSVGKFGEKEIDFICTKNNEKIYIQVAYLLASPEIIHREFDVLQSIPDNYPKYVLSMDKVFGNDINGVKRINICDFLMQKLE